MTDTFRLTEAHLALLGMAQVRWDDTPQGGAPCIDPIHPYGPIGALGAVARTLGIVPAVRPVKNTFGDIVDHLADYSDTDVLRCRQMHRETATALEIVLQLRTFQPGLYARQGARWEQI